MSTTLFNNFTWFNPPKSFSLADEGTSLKVVTKKDTDFWQNTHYDFKRDDGHYFNFVPTANFLLSLKVKLAPQNRYDQAGLLIRQDQGNWAKTSIEYIPQAENKLGSVVTSDYFSDWATLDIPDWEECYFRIIKIEQTVYFAYSQDGLKWRNLRMFHFEATNFTVGLYACSPQGEDFQAEFSECLYQADFTDRDIAYS